MFSIHRELFLASKKVWIIKITPQVPLPGKKIPLPVKSPIPHPHHFWRNLPHPLHPLPLFGKLCYIHVYFAYRYYVYILSMYTMYVYYMFRLYKYTMYVYYGRLDATIAQIFNFLDIHS